MESAEMKRELIELFQTLPVWSTNSLRTQYVTRCPYCGDSQKHFDHGHLSFYINPDDDTKPMMYRCLRCDESGLVTDGVLNDIGLVTDRAISQKLRTYNRSMVSRNPYVNKVSDNNFSIPVFSKSQIHQKKLDYINERLGINVTYETAASLNIILDIFEFMKFNQIQAIPNISYKRLQFINYNYIGFLTSNKNIIVNRCMYDDPSMRRYDNITIDPNNFSTNKYYNLPAQIDLFYTHPINICITEGIFDILSIAHNCTLPNYGQNLFYSGRGFAYASVLKYLIYNGICTDLNVHIYSDNDKSDFAHKKYLSQPDIWPWIDHITIHRNRSEGQKDFGVPKLQIIDGTRKIK